MEQEVFHKDLEKMKERNKSALSSLHACHMLGVKTKTKKNLKEHFPTSHRYSISNKNKENVLLISSLWNRNFQERAQHHIKVHTAECLGFAYS